MNLETKITIYKFTPQLFTLTPLPFLVSLLSDSNQQPRDYKSRALAN